MTVGPVEQDADDQYERTLLAWRRTALSLAVAALLVGQLAIADAGRPALVVTLSGVGLVVAFVWLGGARGIGVTALVLVAGVALVGGMSLVSLVTR